MAKYLDPKADVTFKKVFGGHKNLVISFLNALLPLDPDKKIESIEYLAPEMVPRTPMDKDTIVDVRCRETGGRQFIVEMQMSWTAHFMQRVLFNASKAYVGQLGKGEEYNLLQPVYALSLVNEIYDPELDGYYHYYPMVHYKHPEKVLEGLHIVFVELPKFKPENFTEKKMRVLWMRFLTEINEKTRHAPQDLLDVQETSQALEILEESAYNDAEMLEYDRFWDRASREKTWQSNLARAKAALEALDNAIAERDAEKVRADAAQARADAAIEQMRQDKLQTARKLKALSLASEQIAAATGLSAAEIDTL